MMQQQKQRAEGEGRKQLRAPFTQLAARIVDAKYQLSREEIEVAQKCRTDISYYLAYPVLFGGAAGIGSYRLSYLMRGSIVAVAATVGLSYGARKAETGCLKKFLELDGSQVQAELVDILQRDYPDHPLLRQVLKKRSSHFEGDESRMPTLLTARKECSSVIPPHHLQKDAPNAKQSTPTKSHVELEDNSIVFEQKQSQLCDGGVLQEARDLHSLNNDWVDSDIKGTENQASAPKDMPRQAMRRFQSGARQRQTIDERELEGFGDAGDILVDPFSISAWTEIDCTAREQQNGNAGMKEMRRSRMTSEERRKHNRRLLERRDIGQARHFTNSYI